MNPIKSLLISVVLVTVLNIIINKNGKHLQKEIRVNHYILGYFFILYLIITLAEVVGFPSLFEWNRTIRFNQPIFNPHVNLIPFKDGFEIATILNIILFMPLGFLLPTLWEKYRNFWLTLCYGLFLSIFIEIGQLFVRNRATDINDLIMNTTGTIVGWVIFNTIRKILRKFSTKTAINISSNDTLAIRLEPCLYVVIAVVCAFFR